MMCGVWPTLTHTEAWNDVAVKGENKLDAKVDGFEQRLCADKRKRNKQGWVGNQ